MRGGEWGGRAKVRAGEEQGRADRRHAGLPAPPEPRRANADDYRLRNSMEKNGVLLREGPCVARRRDSFTLVVAIGTVLDGPK